MDREDIEYIESGELGHSTGDGSDAENTLSERIVRKGSRWQVQSEKGRNMGTYDTRKEAEDRLRDIEMFKHMEESGNHSVNESLQDEIERSLPVSDNYLEQSAQYILPDGRFLLLDDPDTGTAAYDDQSDNSGMHGDEFEYLKAAGLFGTWQEYAKYKDSQGWIEASDSHPEEDSCIRIAYIEPTEAQYRSIERFADHCLDSWGYIKVEIGRNQEFYRAFCLDDSHCPDYMDPSNEEVGNFTGYDIARRIRNYFHRVESSKIAEDMTSDGRHIVYRVGQVDNFRQGLFFADSLDYYNNTTEWDAEDAQAYELDLSGARVFDPIREWDMYVNTWSDIRQEEGFLKSKGFTYYDYLDDIDYDDPNTYHEVFTDTDRLSKWAYENGYDAVILRDIPSDGGYGDVQTEYCIINKSLVKPLTQETKQDENYGINESMEGHEVDNEGNVLSKDQSSYFRNSKVRDSSGHLKVVYHGTGSKFNSFSKGDVGFHFGTLGQAKAIAGDRGEGHVDAYYLNIGNPAEMYDFGPTGPYSILWWWKAQSFDDYGSIFGFDMTREELDKINRVLGNMGEKTLDDIHTDADADKCDHEIRDMYNSPQSKLVRGLLGDRGYDGIVYTNNFEDADTNINTGDISYIAFEPNQIKSVSNKTPTNSNNINESTEGSEKDNEGNVLSSEQVEFFKDSKIRTGMNGYGNLRVCYNGQPRDWGNEYRKLDIVQFKFKDKPNDFGFFFTNSRDTASKYAKNNPSSQNGGIVKSVYLNIVNPLVFKNMVCTRDDFLGELRDNNVDTGFDVKDSSRVRRRNVWEWIDLYGSELRKNIVRAGYDGVIFDEGWDKTIVAFNPNQIKSIDNKNPTNSNNINESGSDGEEYLGNIELRQTNDSIMEKSSYGIDIYTAQSKEVLNILKSGKTYVADYSKTSFDYRDEYKKLAELNGFTNCPIFAVPVFNTEAITASDMDDREVLLHLRVPRNEVRCHEYYDWADYIFYSNGGSVEPGEDLDEVLKELEELISEDLSIDSVDTPELILNEIKPEWLVGVEDMNILEEKLGKRHGDLIIGNGQGTLNESNENYEPDVYYRGYDSRYGVFDSNNQYGQLYTWVTDEPEYALEYAEHNEYGKVAKVRVTCDDRKIGGVSDLPDDADYYDPGDDIFREYILSNGLEGYGFTAGEYDDFCMCVSKDCVEVVDPDFKVGDETDESLREGNRLTLDYNSIVKDELETLNKWLDRYDFRVELVDDYEFETHDVGMFLNTIQDDAYVFPIALNRDAIEEYCQGSTSMLVDAIEGTLWHEAGHGIYNFLQDSGCDMPQDEEECVEEFARYVEYSRLFGILDDYMKDYMNTDEPLNESKADQQKFIDKFGQDVFDLFNKSRDRLKNNKVSTDILYHVKNTSVEDMKNILHNLQAKVKTGDNNVDLTKIQGKYNYLGSRDGYDVYEPLDVIASMSLGVGTGWCTTGRYGHAGDVNFKPSLKDAKEHWDEYISEGVRFFYFLQNGIGKYALALYPEVSGIRKFIDDDTYIESCNFELYNQEDNLDYSDFAKIPHDLVGEDLYLNALPMKNDLVLSKDGKTLIRAKAEESIVSYTIPDGVEEIGSAAFYRCISLKSIIIPSSVTSIGNNAFEKCTSLTSIIIPDGIQLIDYFTFAGCKSLTTIHIPDSVEKISGHAFQSCASLLSINIPNGVKSIGSNAFWGCNSLKSIVIPNGITKINSKTFAFCDSLSSINIPEGVTEIGDGAFDHCISLASLIIPDSVTEIGRFAFKGCPNLTVKTNNKYALEYCNEHDIPVEPLNEGLVESEVNTDVSRQYQKDSGNLGEGYFEGDFNEVYDNMLQYESKEPALGPAFITREGTFINLERLHGDIFGDTGDYEGEDFYTLEDNFGLIKLNGGNSYEPFPYVDLWTRPNEMQSRALVEWMYFLMERGKRKVLVNTSSSDRIYEFGKILPEEILKDAFRDMGEQLQERVFDRGIDLGKYVLKYVRENLDDLIQSELDNVYNTYGFTEEDIENEIARINSIHSAQDYIDYVGDGIDWVEDIVLKELQDRFLDIVEYVEDKVYGLISSRDGMDCHLDVTHSFSPGNFPSHYLTVTKEVGDDIEERTIRIGDGHDNGRNDSDLEIDFEDMLDCPDYYDRDIEDLVADLDSSLDESLDSSVINEAKEDWEKFREWCGDDSIYNRFVRVQKRLAGKQRDIYYWMGLEKSLGKHGAMQELLAMLRDVESTPTKREREASARDGATLLYDSNGWKVYKIETLEASQKYGKDTTWCISGDGEGGNYDAADFWEGNEDQTYFFIHGDDKYALIWERGASDWDIWNAMDGKEPYVKGAPAVPGLPDISRPSPELLKGIAKCLGIPAGDILDIHVADYDDELSELFYDYDASGNYIVDTKGGTCYVIDTLGDFEDVTQDIEDALEEYDEE